MRKTIKGWVLAVIIIISGLSGTILSLATIITGKIEWILLHLILSDQ